MRLLNVIMNWLWCFCAVRWNNVLSFFFSKCLIVFRRQGGVLSPLLFALYLVDILHSLSVRKLEYSPDSIQLRYIIYADALVLIPR